MNFPLQQAPFPTRRLRRLRMNPILRKMLEETSITINDLIYPLFVVPGSSIKKEIPSMPGVFHFSIDTVIEEVKSIKELGLPGVILFGIPESKDDMGTEAYKKDGIIPRAIEAIKKKAPDILLVCDVCLCDYTSHGHCGVVIDGTVKNEGVLQNATIENDATLELLAKAAIVYARSGADVIAPSDMMDGRVKAIREVLDAGGFYELPIMSYSAKYASAFYGPFREAAQSAPQFGDRRSYQMPPPNAREALEEVKLDIAEGADIVMVKPALAYMDVIRAVREHFNLPIAAYNVSGEYSMVKAAAKAGWIDEKKVVMEIITGIKRAGADIILTYHAKDIASWLKNI